MSNFRRLEFCTRCGVMTNHNWYDNTPKHHEYTAECGKCKLRTHESKWPRSSENSIPALASPKEALVEKLEQILYDFDVALTLDRTKLEDEKRPLKDLKWFELQYRDSLTSTSKEILDLFTTQRQQLLDDLIKQLPKNEKLDKNDPHLSSKLGYNQAITEVVEVIKEMRK